MKHTPEEIKNRLSNIGEAIGNIALDYITDLEKENAELKEENARLNRLSDMQDKAVVDLTKTCKQRREQLTKAKEIISMT